MLAEVPRGEQCLSTALLGLFIPCHFPPKPPSQVVSHFFPERAFIPFLPLFLWKENWTGNSPLIRVSQSLRMESSGQRPSAPRTVMLSGSHAGWAAHWEAINPMNKLRPGLNIGKKLFFSSGSPQCRRHFAPPLDLKQAHFEVTEQKKRVRRKLCKGEGRDGATHYCQRRSLVRMRRNEIPTDMCTWAPEENRSIETEKRKWKQSVVCRAQREARVSIMSPNIFTDVWVGSHCHCSSHWEDLEANQSHRKCPPPCGQRGTVHGQREGTCNGS